MFSQEFIIEIEDLIANGNTHKAIKRLNQSKKVLKGTTLKKSLILIIAQWNNHKRDKLENIKSEAILSKELNRINESILSFLERQTEPTTNGAIQAIKDLTQHIFALKRHLIVVLIIIVILVSVIFFFKFNG